MTLDTSFVYIPDEHAVGGEVRRGEGKGRREGGTRAPMVMCLLGILETFGHYRCFFWSLHGLCNVFVILLCGEKTRHKQLAMGIMV